jgi:hypothetical protein
MVFSSKAGLLPVIAALIVAAVASSCRDMDEPPPPPAHDPNAPLDGGADAAEDGAIT